MTNEIEKTREELSLQVNEHLHYFNLGVQLAHKEFLDFLESSVIYSDNKQRNVKAVELIEIKINQLKQQLEEKDGEQQ